MNKKDIDVRISDKSVTFIHKDPDYKFTIDDLNELINRLISSYNTRLVIMLTIYKYISYIAFIISMYFIVNLLFGIIIYK